MSEAELTASQLQRVQEAIGKVPYAQLLGIDLEDIGKGTATLGLKVRKELLQYHGVVHGGAIASLIDSAMAFAILSLVEPDEKVTTVDLTVSFLRPVTEGRIRGMAKVVRAGRRILTLSAEVFDANGKLVATALSTYIKI